MKLSLLFDLNFSSSVKEEHPGIIGELVENSKFYNIFRPILGLLFNVLKQFNSKTKIKTYKNIETVAVVNTLNQYRALEYLIQDLPNVLVISTFPIDSEPVLLINRYGNSWISLINLPKILIYLFKKKGFEYKSMIYHFSDYLHTPGVYNQANEYLKLINPKSVIVANDHTSLPRSYFRIAQKLGMNTIYTQHASVSNNFPKLEFDYAFLDGKESLDKYTSNNKIFTTKVFLSGSPRFDQIARIQHVNLYDLGVAINLLDDTDKLMSFINLLTHKNINFAIRPHPSLPNISFWKEYCENFSIGYSDPIIEKPIHFISACKLFVVGDSAFHLEVALSNKVSYFVNFQNNSIIDWYEYIGNELVEIKTIEEVVSYLSNKTDKPQIEKVKYYVSNFATKDWGKSATLIIDTIIEINNQGTFNHWELESKYENVFKIK